MDGNNDLVTADLFLVSVLECVFQVIVTQSCLCDKLLNCHCLKSFTCFSKGPISCQKKCH